LSSDQPFVIYLCIRSLSAQTAPTTPPPPPSRYAGDAFSVSDVAVGAYIAYVEIFFPNVSFSQYKNVTKYMESMKTRPAFQQTIGTEYK
jgi:glutathione S-transferase